MNIIDSLLRICLALLIGGGIGFERGLGKRPAGFRTHILVAVGSTVVMMTGLSLSSTGSDPTRMAAQVISGIGFLGAGTILHEGLTVKGLTTAASLWTVACLGLAIGAGYFTGALIGAAAVFLTLTVLEIFERKTINSYGEKIQLNICCQNLSDLISDISPLFKKHKIEIRDINVSQGKGDLVCASFKLAPAFKMMTVKYDILAEEAAKLPFVSDVKICEY